MSAATQDRAQDTRAAIRVLHVLAPPDGTTKFVDQMLGSAPDDLHPRTFSWRLALRGRYDVLHLHWPELLIRGRTPLHRLGKRLAVRALLARLRLRRVPLVRTLHNLAPHESGSRTEQRLLALIDRRTDLFVRLNPTTPLPAGAGGDVVLVPHGHYRDRFAPLERETPVPGRVLFIGLIRPYKGVERLVETVRAIDDPALSLRIVGSPSAGMRELLDAAAADDDRVGTRFAFVDDAELVREVSAAELVVLPYRELHNSGIVFVALSLGRPVLVPDNPTTAQLAAEVGSGWVARFAGELEPGDLTDALASAAAVRAGVAPVLDDRDWASVGSALRDAYARVLERGARR